jgi:hypothetical protein
MTNLRRGGLLSREDFFDLIYSDLTNNVYISLGGVGEGKWFKWPNQRDDLLAFVAENDQQDVYFSVSDYTKPVRRKEHAGMASIIYVDADEWDTESAWLEPSVVVETRPGRYHAYWLLTEPITAEDASVLAHKISAAHADEGCDKSSWPVTKVLRVPETLNCKDPENPFPIEVTKFEGVMYSASDIAEKYGDVPVNVYTVDNRPLPGDLPSRIDIQSTMGDVRLSMYLDEPEPGTDMSAYMWAMECMLFEWGYTAEEVFVLMSDVTHNKYHPKRVGEVTASGAVRPRRADPDGDLWNEILRAEAATKGEIPEEIVKQPAEDPEPEPKAAFLTPEEEAIVEKHRTFVDEYVQWAATRTDAPHIYHRNLALILLSCVYGAKARIKYQHSSEPLNLWLILLGDTTVSRKTTSVRLMEEVLEIYEEFVGDRIDIGADFSPEALTKKLGERDGKVSLINRDEVQGFFKAVLGKSYMSDSLDVLTNLYGGKVKQVLRTNKETAQERRASTVFNLLMYGIAEQTAQQLSEENFQSGFLQRFTWVISPPIPLTPDKLRNKQGSLEDLTDKGYDTWAQNTAMKMMTREEQLAYEGRYIFFEDDAFERAMDWKTQVIFEMMPDETTQKAYAPTISRMESHILRAAALMAMHDGLKKVTLPYVLKAIKIAEDWFDGFEQMRRDIVGSDFAARTNEVLRFIESKGKGQTVPLSSVYRKFSNYPPRVVEEWLEALKAREEIYLHGNKAAIRGKDND